MSKALLILLCAIAPLCAQRGRIVPGSESSPPVARSAAEKKVFEAIEAAVRAGDLYANVPAADGRLLRMLAESMGAKHVVEIGTSTGISGLWIALALEKTGGRLTTFELDPRRAALARKHFEQGGVASRVTIVEGDAHVNLAKLQGPVDMVFLDADKDGQVDYLNKLLPLMRPGGLILAHNTDMIPAYMRAVNANTDLDTVIYTAGGGMAVTLKKR